MESNGGSAFPVTHPTGGRGMSLRDYFAAKAMEAIVSRLPAMPNERIADQAYALADEMLKRRDSGK